MSSGRVVMLTSHFQLALRLRMSGAIPLPLLYVLVVKIYLSPSVRNTNMLQTEPQVASPCH